MVAVHTRSGLTLIELVTTTVILAISAAMVVPRWSRSVERAELSAMRSEIESTINALRRSAVRSSQTIHLSIPAGGQTISLTPPQPQLAGGPTGLIDFSSQYPNISISAIDLDGNPDCDINLQGDLVSTSSSARLSAGLLTLNGYSKSTTIDLLAAQGTTSTPTPEGQSAEEEGEEEGVVEEVVEEVGEVVEEVVGGVTGEATSTIDTLNEIIKGLFSW